jgi:hypothetical protein
MTRLLQYGDQFQSVSLRNGIRSGGGLLTATSVVGVGSMSGQWSPFAKEGVAALSKGDGVPGYGDVCRQEGQWYRQTRKVVRQ